MAFQLLTIGREFGCGSGEIAQQLATRLGWKLYDRELIDEIARVAHLDPGACRGADERAAPWLQRIGKHLWSAAGEKGPATVPDAQLDADLMASLTRQVIEDVAVAGACVIVGRGGNYILHQRPDAFHLFLYATHAWRVRRIEAQGQRHAEADSLIHRMDEDRAAYIRRYFGQEWPRRSCYHLLANVSLGVPAVVEATLRAMTPAAPGPAAAK